MVDSKDFLRIKLPSRRRTNLQLQILLIEVLWKSVDYCEVGLMLL